MPDAPTSESLYVGLLYIGLKRFVKVVRPIFYEQIRDESPAVLLAEQSFRQIKHEYLVLKNLLVQKLLVEHAVDQNLVAACEAVRLKMSETLNPFLARLRLDALNNTWVEEIAGDEDRALFSDKYQNYLTEVVELIKKIKELLTSLERKYAGLDKLKWNRKWRANVRVPSINDRPGMGDL